MLIATNEGDLQNIRNISDGKSEKVGLGINIKKTGTMIITKQKELPECKIKTHFCAAEMCFFKKSAQNLTVT